jgi:diguanylate cyclase (GGDEF)-like protein
MLRSTGATGTPRAMFDRLMSRIAVDSEERALAGVVSGLLYLSGGVTLSLFMVLPGVSRAHPVALLVDSGLACAWGAISLLLIPWPRAPRWLIHVSLTAGFAAITVGVASSGGEASPAWLYLYFIAVFAAYFFTPRVAGVYVAGCVAAHALPLLYDPRALHSSFGVQLLIGATSYVALGGAVAAGKLLTLGLRTRAEQLAAEQGSLRRVATAVVGGEPAERIYELVALESAALLGAGAAGILRLDAPDRATVMGSWADHEGGRYEPGTSVPVRPGSDVARAVETNLAVRIDDHSVGSPVRRLGYDSSIVAPIHVAGRVWGALAVTMARPARLTQRDEDRLQEFGDLLATAIASIEDRTKLAAQASTDPLTGLPNHRTLHQRLAVELARAKRYDTPLSVAVIDIDQFKQLNDIGGHETGDELLASVARCLARAARTEDTIGRVGGDEFAWIFPETSRQGALVAVERARRMIAATVREPYRVTVSAGICDTEVTADPAELIRLADGALYWSKAHGRNQCWIYDPAVVAELSAQERAERLERSQALLGLRALARAIDAKDPATSEHSDRVSALVGRLARTAGWSDHAAQLLSEAALVHDVGKIGIPDAVLRKTEPLTDEEWTQIRGHAELSARIVEGVLGPEQVEWIRTHHERPDGAGYPRGLRGAQIPEGVALLAMADAWDVMTVSRPYSTPKTTEEALAESVALIGLQFTRAAVDALAVLHAGGDLVALGAQPGALVVRAAS